MPPTPQASQIPSRARNIVASDTTVYVPPLTGLAVMSGNDVTVVTAYDYARNPDAPETVIFQGCPAGFIIPLQISMVMDTGTVANQIVGFGAQ